jgi:hypothetical protein
LEEDKHNEPVELDDEEDMEGKEQEEAPKKPTK